MSNGRIIYRGPSRITGAPVVVVAILKSANTKTGDMVQTYILSDEGQNPFTASVTGADRAVCGDCKHRRHTGGACYVNLAKGPSQVYKALQAGSYPDISGDTASIAVLGHKRKIRIGAYGDPAAVPVELWKILVSLSLGHSGYTHQWENSISDGLQNLVMASVDTEDEAKRAKLAGWRYFRVMGKKDNLINGEFSCPASEEGGYRKNCFSCLACDGARPGKGTASVAIIVHGTLAKRFARQ